MSLIKATGKAVADVIPGLRFMPENHSGKIFITSGTGVIGYRVAMSLLEAGHKAVSVGVWKGERKLGPGAENDCFASNIANILAAKGAEVVDFDWTDETTYENALKNVQTVFCTIPHMDQWASVFPAFLGKCKALNIEHFVKVSFLRHTDAGDRYREAVPFVSFHNTVDDLLEQAPKTSKISYTILSTSHLMSTPLLHQGKLLKEEGKFVVASYGMGVNYCSPNDVADAAVVVLLDQKNHRNKTYNLTGPGPTYDKDVARLLSKAYGKEIEFVSLGYHDYKKDVMRRGLPQWLVRDSAAFEKMKASGIDELRSSYTTDLVKLIGKTPESFSDYLDNKNAQRPGLTFP